MHVERHISSSWIWKEILKSCSFLSQRHCFLVGSGETIRTWQDLWLPNLPSFIPRPKIGLHRLNSASLVSHFVLIATRSWDVNLLNNTFDRPSVNSILQIHLPPHGAEDKLVWTPDSKVLFMVKSAYKQNSLDRLSSLHPSPSINWKKLWRLNMHERLKFLLWKMPWDILPSRQTIA